MTLISSTFKPDWIHKKQVKSKNRSCCLIKNASYLINHFNHNNNNNNDNKNKIKIIIIIIIITSIFYRKMHGYNKDN
jgi:hypothetical protein